MPYLILKRILIVLALKCQHKYADIETTDPYCSNNKIQGNLFSTKEKISLFIHSKKTFPADVFD